MAEQGDDCYFFYYSSCTKGASCPFRHCEAALGSETTCSLWREGRCYRPQCKFRHMEIQKDRNAIACYWENMPGGCQKPHCVFKHFKPRNEYGDPVDSVEAKVAAKLFSQRRSIEALEADSASLPAVPTPKVTPVVVNPFEEESDQESTASTPVKHSQREHLTELVAPAPPRRVAIGKPQPQGTERSGGQSLGIKSLDELRDEKELLARAKKLIEETEEVANLGLSDLPDDDLDDDIKVEAGPRPGQVVRRIQIGAGGDAKENKRGFSSSRKIAVQPVTSGTEGRRIIVMDDGETDAPVHVHQRLGVETRGGEEEHTRVVTKRKAGEEVQSRLGVERKITTRQEVQSRLGVERKITTRQEVQSRLGGERKITARQEIQSRLGVERKAGQEVQSRLGPARVTLASRLKPVPEPEPEPTKVIRVAARVNPVSERLQARVSPVKAGGTLLTGGSKRLQDRLGSRATNSSSDDGETSIRKRLGVKRDDADTASQKSVLRRLGQTGQSQDTHKADSASRKSVLRRLGQSGQSQDTHKTDSDSGEDSKGGSQDSSSLDTIKVKSLFQIKREKARQRLLEMKKNSSKEEQKDDPAPSSPRKEVRRVRVGGPLTSLQKKVQKEDSTDTDTNEDVEIRIKSLEEIRKEKAEKSEACVTGSILVKAVAELRTERQPKQQSQEADSQGEPSKDETTATKVKSLAELRKERLQQKLQKQKQGREADSAEEPSEAETTTTVSPRKVRRTERQIYKPPSVRQTEQKAPPRVPVKEEPVKVEERLKPAITKKTWARVKTFSEIMQEKRVKAQELQQQSASSSRQVATEVKGATAKPKRSFSPIHFEEDKKETTDAKKRRTHQSSPIVFDIEESSEESGKKAAKKRPASAVVFEEVQEDQDTDLESFGVGVQSTAAKVSKTVPAKAPAEAVASVDTDNFVISVSMGDKDLDSVDQDVVSSSDSKQPVAAVPPQRTTPALAARKRSLSQPAGDDDSVSSSDQTVTSADVPEKPVVVSLRRQSSGRSVSSQRSAKQDDTEETSQQPTVTPGGRRKRSKGSSLSEDKSGTLRQDSFLDQDLDDLLGGVDDDLDQDVTSRTHSVSKTEDDLLLEMEELLA